MLSVYPSQTNKGQIEWRRVDPRADPACFHGSELDTEISHFARVLVFWMQLITSFLSVRHGGHRRPVRKWESAEPVGSVTSKERKAPA